MLRAIKPLRALTRSAGMQQIFKSLTLSLAAMGNVSVVVLLFFLIFAILGTQVCVPHSVCECARVKSAGCGHLPPPSGLLEDAFSM